MRLPNWKARLRAALDDAGRESFAYGRHDCLQLVARGVAAVTGVDHAPRFGRYRSLTGAQRILRPYGYDIGRLLTDVLGPPVAPNLVGAGDVVEAVLYNGATAGICEGYLCAFAGARGIVQHDRAIIRRGWKVT